MTVESGSAFPVTRKSYDVTYRDAYEQIDSIQAILVHTFAESFLVFLHNDKLLLIPKDRVFIMREADTPKLAQPPGNVDRQRPA